MSLWFMLEGKVVYVEIGMGFWGIVTADGTEYRPVNMPDQLKKKDARIRCLAEEYDEEMSIHMWGTPIKVLGFYTTLD